MHSETRSCCRKLTAMGQMEAAVLEEPLVDVSHRQKETVAAADW